MRHAANTIRSLEREDGSLAVEEGEIQQVTVDYFAALFDTLSPSNIDRVLEDMNARVTEDMNATLCASYHETEVLEALQMMHPNKAPGPDDFNPLFFLKLWDVVARMFPELFWIY